MTPSTQISKAILAASFFISAAIFAAAGLYSMITGHPIGIGMFLGAVPLVFGARSAAIEAEVY